ncbi:Mu transposase C-terminal domain-containing protein [Thioalkalivibrio sp. ALJ24]|uniref:Mu transposase C-terminal domain-containing protein n=1 Tax=Thioalkalivibrio sp. ALJ24 TaxID=545276 RepID=UPI0003A5177C|nr:Mu transposase C-terminal domain-containing protein [Thioalkalivibrio sp. ALJ24]
MKVSFELKPGTDVRYQGRAFVVHQLLDYNRVLVKDSESGELRSVSPSVLSPPEPEAGSGSSVELELISDEDWNVAQERMAVIRPLLENDWRSVVDVQQAAKEAGVNQATIYRWIQRYEVTGRASSLVPVRRGPKPGGVRIPDEVEEVIQATIEERYLSKQRPKIQVVCQEVIRRCKTAGLKPPHPNTVRNRIRTITDRRKMERRLGRRTARERYEPTQGQFPDAQWPLHTVQIDHTPVDLIIVDDDERKPIGRPSLTLAMDVFSRMVTGFSVSLEAPGSLPVGLALAHSILPKDGWMLERGIDGEWPVWGLPGTVHADNAKEFRGDMLKRACSDYGIDLHWRPVAHPNFGGHVERLLGTFNAEIHNLPGTTFSNIEERMNYDSSGMAAFTLSEFEVWIATYITQIYHQTVHSALGVSPLKKWEEGILGTDHQVGRGLPARVRDEERLKIDFLPWEERTVQRHGVVLDHVAYYADVLRPWVHATDPNGSGKKRKFLIRRDPRDISVVYFFDPQHERYFDLPYRNTSHPKISLWELREAQRRLRQEGRDAQDEDAIFEAHERLRKIEDEASRQTARARRQAQRRKNNKQVARTSYGSHPEASPLDSHDDDGWGDIDPYDDVEV